MLLAASFAAATEILTRREARPGLAISTALFATGTLAALALALTFALDKGWLTIALALMSTGAAWVSMQRPIPFLRVLSSILAGIVVLADRLRAAHRRQCGRHDADLQLAIVGLWHSGAVILGRTVCSCGDEATTHPLRSVEAAADPLHGPAWCSWKFVTP